MRKLFVFTVCLAAQWLSPCVLAGPVDLTFPQVAAGFQTLYIETVIVLHNPHPDSVAVSLTSLGIEAAAESEFILEPREVRKIVFSSSGEARAGSVQLRVESLNPEVSGISISALAQITTRSTPTSEEILSQVNVPAQPLAARSAVPVFRRAENVHDTGIAVAMALPGVLRFTLRDEAGEVVRTGRFEVAGEGGDRKLAGRLSLFLTELFPSFPNDFEAGSLSVEYIEPTWSPPALAAVALYTRDNRLQTAAVTPVDQPATYRVMLTGAGLDLNQLAEQYRADLDAAPSAAEALITMSSRTAESLSRDPRVLEVEPDPAAGESFLFTFESGMEGWRTGFADYPAGSEDDFQLRAAHVPLPASLGEEGAILLEGINRSDDLFMFLTRNIDGLKPLTSYRVKFLVEVATDVPRGLGGIGGPPGEAVWIKAGASLLQPDRFLDESGDYRMNIDKGNQSVGGEEAIVLGDFAKSTFNFPSVGPELKPLTNYLLPFEITTDAEGSVWVIVGSDSGFEGKTSVRYNRIEVRFFEQ